MVLSQLERTNALILAKVIAGDHAMLELRGALPGYIQRLHKYQLFTTKEIAAFANTSEYKIKQYIIGLPPVTHRSGIKTRHLDHLIRMVTTSEFTKKHLQSLLDDGATIHAIARVIGISESTLYRWLGGTKEKGK